MNCATNLKNAVWLDILDVEPLPAKANLLATMLTRIRNSLYQQSREESEAPVTSILEKGSKSARHMFDQLIKHATLMWEDIQEPDTRNMANRQAEAADIYSQYKGLFNKAMKSLSNEIAVQRGTRDGYHPVILPIDNIDRSAEHLYNIVKLAQMVSCPYLWIVLAGGQEDIEIFLERAYWKELISVGSGAAIGKKNLQGEDDSLVTARRQSAAALHKILPPSHRIHVHLMDARSTLHYSGNGNAEDSIYRLLEKIDVPMLWSKKDLKLLSFFLLDFERINQTINSSSTPIDEKNITQIGKIALTLPARRVLDLWKLAYFVQNDKINYPDKEDKKKYSSRDERREENAEIHDLISEMKDGPNFDKGVLKAEKIARTMLMGLISESRLSNHLSQHLMNEIILHDPDRGTIIDFFPPNPELRILSLHSRFLKHRMPKLLQNSLQEDFDNRPYRIKAISSTLLVSEESSALRFILSPQTDNQNAKYNDSDRGELPSLVASWLIILCDIVRLAPNWSWILNVPEVNPYRQIIRSRHDILITSDNNCPAEIRLDYEWPAPPWDSTLEYEIFQAEWKSFINNLDVTLRIKQVTMQEKILFKRMLASGWIWCILHTFHNFMKHVDKNDFPEFMEKDTAFNNHCNWSNDAIYEHELEVFSYAAKLYSEIKNDSRNDIYFHKSGTESMMNWLEKKLPFMLHPLYANSLDENKKELDSCNYELMDYWSKNADFINAEMKIDLVSKLDGYKASLKKNSYSYQRVERIMLEYMATCCILQE